MNELVGQSWLASILTQLIDAGAVLDGVKVHLFKNDLQLSPGMLVSSFVEADYSGYAASSVVVWGSPFLDAGGNGQVVGDTKQFHPTSSTVACDVYGYWIMPTAGSTTPIKAVRFSSPIPMTGPLSALIITPTFEMPQI